MTSPPNPTRIETLVEAYESERIDGGDLVEAVGGQYGDALGVQISVICRAFRLGQQSRAEIEAAVREWGEAQDAFREARRRNEGGNGRINAANQALATNGRLLSLARTLAKKGG